MQHTPQRPFVPDSTPSAPRKPTGPAIFKLARPFIHGAQRLELSTKNRTAADQVPPSLPPVRSAPPPLPLKYDPPVEARLAPSIAAQDRAADAISQSNAIAEPESLASIQLYLQTEPVYARDASTFDENSSEPPPVEHFMDAPEGAGSAAEGNGELMTEAPGFEDTDVGAENLEWGDTDWLQYDWRSAAALGEAADSEASSAWSETDWENASVPVRRARATTAKAIADALDAIARRIRDGELVVPSPGSGADPAAIAATVAALLGVKR